MQSKFFPPRARHASQAPRLKSIQDKKFSFASRQSSIFNFQSSIALKSPLDKKVFVLYIHRPGSWDRFLCNFKPENAA